MKFFLVIATLLYCSSLVSAQLGGSVAPIEWKLFADSETNISIMFPKFPTKDDTSDVCTERAAVSYFAYADEVVYKASVITEGKGSRHPGCVEKDDFDSGTFSRIATKRGASIETLRIGLSVAKYSANGSRTWLFRDAENRRLIELSVTGRAGTGKEELRFFDSLRLLNDPAATPIGDGADQTIGDLVKAEEPGAAQDMASVSNGDFPYQVIHHPRAKYTREARKKDVQGSVLLKIVLLANGSVGTIKAVTEQPYGLTEQAIAAAKKIVFVPKKKNGANVSIIISREYAFSTY